ncbi:MAG: hypothetical protein ACRDTD_07540 [Pseudonocardiaceae bacterium]
MSPGWSLAVEEQAQRVGGRVVERPLRRCGLVTPAQPHGGSMQDPPQVRHVLGGDGNQHDALPTQLGTRGHTESRRYLDR